MYDRLIGADLLGLDPVAAERIFGGRMRARSVMPQAEINALLVRLARARIPFQVPGITAAFGSLACAAFR